MSWKYFSMKFKAAVDSDIFRLTFFEEDSRVAWAVSNAIKIRPGESFRPSLDSATTAPPYRPHPALSPPPSLAERRAAFRARCRRKWGGSLAPITPSPTTLHTSVPCPSPTVPRSRLTTTSGPGRPGRPGRGPSARPVATIGQTPAPGPDGSGPGPARRWLGTAVSQRETANRPNSPGKCSITCHNSQSMQDQDKRYINPSLRPHVGNWRLTSQRMLRLTRTTAALTRT